MKDLVNLLEQAISFNYKAGNKVPEYDTFEYWRAVENQSKLMIEESTEGEDAAKVNCPVESINALCEFPLVVASRGHSLELLLVGPPLVAEHRP